MVENTRERNDNKVGPGKIFSGTDLGNIATIIISVKRILCPIDLSQWNQIINPLVLGQTASIKNIRNPS